jgi:hypothetical protein
MNTFAVEDRRGSGPTGFWSGTTPGLILAIALGGAIIFALYDLNQKIVTTRASSAQACSCVNISGDKWKWRPRGCTPPAGETCPSSNSF